MDDSHRLRAAHRFLADGIMPAGGPKAFTNDFAQQANKHVGTKVTTNLAYAKG